MSDFEAGVDFDLLEQEMNIDRQVRMGRLMLEINESITALNEQNRIIGQLADDLDAMLDRLGVPRYP